MRGSSNLKWDHNAAMRALSLIVCEEDKTQPEMREVLEQIPSVEEKIYAWKRGYAIEKDMAYEQNQPPQS